MRFKSEFKNYYKSNREFIPRGYKTAIDKIYNVLVNDEFTRDTFEDNLYTILDLNITIARQQEMINNFIKECEKIYKTTT